MSALEEKGELKKEMFVGGGGEELEADGEIVRREAAGHGNGGHAGEVGGAIVAQE
jgi:hypothetical protein